MNANTKKAIQRRIDAGQTEFRVGNKYYRITATGGVLSEYVDGYGYAAYGPMIEGVVVDGIFDPGHIFTPEEKAAAAARRAAKN